MRYAALVVVVLAITMCITTQTDSANRTTGEQNNRSSIFINNTPDVPKGFNVNTTNVLCGPRVVITNPGPNETVGKNITLKWYLNYTSPYPLNYTDKKIAFMIQLTAKSGVRNLMQFTDVYGKTYERQIMVANLTRGDYFMLGISGTMDSNYTENGCMVPPVNVRLISG